LARTYQKPNLQQIATARKGSMGRFMAGGARGKQIFHEELGFF